MSKKSVASVNTLLWGLTFLMFLWLKLTNTPASPVHQWSWWWVSSPIWMPMLLVVGFLLLFLIVLILVGLVKGFIMVYVEWQKQKRLKAETKRKNNEAQARLGH